MPGIILRPTHRSKADVHDIDDRMTPFNEILPGVIEGIVARARAYAHSAAFLRRLLQRKAALETRMTQDFDPQLSLDLDDVVERIQLLHEQMEGRAPW